MNLTIHRGTHEIGGSCVEIKSRGSRIVVDIGMPLVKPGGERFDFKEYGDLSGEGLVKKKILPDMAGFYEWDADGSKVDGLFISHSHLDHYGLYEYVRKDIPCFLGEGTKRIIDINNLFLGSNCHIGLHTIIKSGVPVEAGNFKVTPYLMDHSAFDSYAFLIESGGKKVLYSGDFREHGRKSKVFHRFLREVPEGVDALLLEGSLMGGRSEQQETEEEIEKKIIDTIRNSNSITLCLLSSQNIDRLVSFFKAALKTGKLFVIDVYTANVLDSLKNLANIPHPSKGFSNIRVVFTKWICDRLVKEGKYELMRKFKDYKITKKEISGNPSNYVMVVKTSMLFDLSRIKGIEGGTLIYSMWEGYLKDRSMERFLEFIKKRQMEIIYIHTSGHARLDTLKKVVEKTKPKMLIPIHTFYPERFSELSPNVLQVSDGLEIEI